MPANVRTESSAVVYDDGMAGLIGSCGARFWISVARLTIRWSIALEGPNATAWKERLALDIA
jgi:hypothetical protein